jgi:hypothetical protein
VPKIKFPNGKVVVCNNDQVRDLLNSGCELVDKPVVSKETPEEVAAIMAEVEAEDKAAAEGKTKAKPKKKVKEDGEDNS